MARKLDQNNWTHCPYKYSIFYALSDSLGLIVTVCGHPNATNG